MALTGFPVAEYVLVGNIVSKYILVGNLHKYHLDTTSATATADDILEGKSAFAHGNKVVGKLKKTTGKFTKRGTFTPPAGTLYESVEVAVPEAVFQEKNVEPSEEPQEIRPDHGFDGLSCVSVEAVETEEKTVTKNGVIEPTEGKYLRRVVVSVGHGGGSDANLAPLSVTENGTYYPTYEAATVTWDEHTEYDGVIDVDGIPLRYKKVANLTVPDDVSDLENPAYSFSVTWEDGTTETAPLSNLWPGSADGVYLLNDNGFAVVWVKDATFVNVGYGASLEDNTVYVTDYLYLANSEYSGATLSLTAQGQSIDGFSSVKVNVEAEPKLIGMQFGVTAGESKTVYPPEGYDGLSSATAVAHLPDGYIKPNGTKTVKENGTHDVTEFSKVDVAVPEPVLQEKITTVNGEVTPDDGYDALSKVIVAVPNSGGSADLNIAYSDTEPVDTSKLWVKADQPAKVLINNDFDGVESLRVAVSALPTKAAAVAVSAVGTKIYQFGGYYYNSMLDTISVFDTETEKNTKLSVTLPYPFYHMAAASVGTKIYLFGGLYKSGTSTSASRTIYEFDTETYSLKSVASLPMAALQGVAVTVGNKIYLFGFVDSTSNTYKYISTVLVFDPETKTVTASTAIGNRLGLAAAAVGTNIYLFGGVNQTSSTNSSNTLKDIRVFDTLTGALTTLSAKFDNGIYRLSASAIGSKIYIFGGSSQPKSICKFDAETNSLITLPNTLAENLYMCGSASVGNKVYLFGGCNQTSFASNATYYNEIKSFNVDSELPRGNIQLVPAVTGCKIPLIQAQGMSLDIGIDGAYLGNAENKAEFVDAYMFTGVEEVVSVNKDYSESATQLSSGTELTATVNCYVGDLVVAAIATRDTLTISDGWTLISTSGTNSADSYNQRLSWAWKFAENETESITVTQASEQRLYINMVALQGATGVTDNGYSYRDDTTSGNMTVEKPDGLVLWGLSTPLWGTTAPYPLWTASNDSPIIQLSTDAQSRLGIAVDQTDEVSVTFQSGSNESTMIVGSLTVHGMDKFYTDNSYNRRVWENVNTGEKLTFRVEE